MIARYQVRGPNGPHGSPDRWTVVDTANEDEVLFRSSNRRRARDAVVELEVDETEDEE